MPSSNIIEELNYAILIKMKTKREEYAHPKNDGSNILLFKEEKYLNKIAKIRQKCKNEKFFVLSLV